MVYTLYTKQGKKHKRIRRININLQSVLCRNSPMLGVSAGFFVVKKGVMEVFLGIIFSRKLYSPVSQRIDDPGWVGFKRCMVDLSTCGLSTRRFDPVGWATLQIVHPTDSPPNELTLVVKQCGHLLCDRTTTTGRTRPRTHRIKKQVPYPLGHPCVWVGFLPSGDNRNRWGVSPRPSKHSKQQRRRGVLALPNRTSMA